MQTMHVLKSRVTNREQNATTDDTMAAKVESEYIQIWQCLVVVMVTDHLLMTKLQETNSLIVKL